MQANERKKKKFWFDSPRKEKKKGANNYEKRKMAKIRRMNFPR